jgi:hypothetical protein
MSLFKKKMPVVDDDVVRCPTCNELLPDGASECAMRGRDVSDVVAVQQRPGARDPD